MENPWFDVDAQGETLTFLPVRIGNGENERVFEMHFDRPLKLSHGDKWSFPASHRVVEYARFGATDKQGEPVLNDDGKQKIQIFPHTIEAGIPVMRKGSNKVRVHWRYGPLKNTTGGA